MSGKPSQLRFVSSDRRVRDAVRAALADVETMSDPHASPAYRRRAAAELAVRAVVEARAEALEKARAH